jgi:uncharacterized membrane protein YphA (DoxX/SURF4 family)
MKITKSQETSMNLNVKDNAESILTSPRLYEVLRFGLGALFVYAGVIKLLDPKSFARIVSAYDLVPDPLLPVFAVGLPLLETIAGIGLLFDIRGSLAAISGLLLLFIAVLGYGILRNLDVDCGCFGTEELAKQDSLRLAFYRDLLLIVVVVPCLYLSRWRRKHEAEKKGS